MITTIQIHENVKRALERLKEKERESYEEIIVKLMNLAEKQKRNQEQLLIEGCKEMAEDDIKLVKEWKHAESEWPDW